MDVQLTDYRKDVKNTRKGYFTLVVNGLMVKKCVAHKHPGGKKWFAPPALQRADGGYENVVCCATPELNDLLQARVSELLEPYLRDE